jgi:hypothetical protein
MKWRAKIVLVLLSIVAIVADAQSKTAHHELSQETQARGYWVDPSTGLMWAWRDNVKEVNWHQATKYCRNLRLAGYSDWRLATIDELQGIYDASAYASLPVQKGTEYALAGRAKGGLSLTGNYIWSSSRVNDDRGHSLGTAWQFDFPSGKRQSEPLGYYGSKRALCVRGSGK